MNYIQLLEGQAYKRNTARRNRFYEQFGFTFDYLDAQHRAGMSHPVKVRDLKAVESGKDNIAERRVFDFLMEQADSQRAAQVEAGGLFRSLQDLIGERKRAEAHPIWWARWQVYYGVPTGFLARH
ncbi:hypothetical protein PTKU46_97920 [Paraburkholderia terrae]|uniref:hypothetical protein n=1 Tax=Paraburkholderia terrae TaxID=311230 RepID=UPI0030E17F29